MHLRSTLSDLTVPTTRFYDAPNLGSHPSLSISIYKGKVTLKVKLTLCLTKHHAMKAYGGVEV
jgi:hypothetical protein